MGGAPLGALVITRTSGPAERIRATIWAIALPATGTLLVLLAVAFGASAVRARWHWPRCSRRLPWPARTQGSRWRGGCRSSGCGPRAAVVLAVLGVSAIVRPLLS